ncbi:MULTISPECIES: hypothetical protein [unclassified Streptomyces]|uniref:hypothetical protein n=1 Tax=unclassified Streptomyces TaxID=2593676 RepID=UPI002E27DBBF|nr:hypothetical protein [Streptomyces sp. NBC_00223]
MNGQETNIPPQTILLALLGLLAALGVIAVILLGDSWARWVYFGLLIVGILVASGAIGALVKVLVSHGN